MLDPCLNKVPPLSFSMTKQMIFLGKVVGLQCVNHCSQCVCVKSLEMCVCVCLIQRREQTQNLCVLMAKSKASIIEVTLLLHNHLCDLYDYFLLKIQLLSSQSSF